MAGPDSPGSEVPLKTPPPAPAGPTQADLKKMRKPRKPKKTPVPPELQPPGAPDPQVGPVEVAEIIEGSIGKIQDEVLKKRFGLTKGKRVKPAESPSLSVAGRVIPRFSAGKATVEIRDEVAQVTEGIEEKFKILDGIINNHTMERWELYVKGLWKLEQSVISGDLDADKLTPLEKLALMKLMLSEIKVMENRITGGANPLSGVVSTMEKVDSVNKQAQADLAKRLAGTTPQGREVARRLAFQAIQMSKRLNAAADQAALQ